jgi:hypothetical protein
MPDPITYHPDFLTGPLATRCFERLRDELEWARRDQTPRMEYYVGRDPYQYGKGGFSRTYLPQASHDVIDLIPALIHYKLGVEFDVCFLNRYLDQSDHLGWRSDDSDALL